MRMNDANLTPDAWHETIVDDPELIATIDCEVSDLDEFDDDGFDGFDEDDFDDDFDDDFEEELEEEDFDDDFGESGLDKDLPDEKFEDDDP